MISFLALFAVCLVAAIAMAFGINYFLHTGPWRAMGYALLGLCAFLLFCASGIWEDAPSQHIGILTTVFALLLVGGWLCLKFGQSLWLWHRKRRK